MNIKAFRKPSFSGDAIFNTVAAIDDYVRPITNNPIIGAQILKQVAVTSGTTNIPHSLNQPWSGWMIIRKNVNINVWESATQAPSNRFISLTASGSGLVDIYIF